MQNMESAVISADNRDAIDAATARRVNDAVAERLRLAALAEQQRVSMERRVWRWALGAMCALMLLGAAFAVLSLLHWL